MAARGGGKNRRTSTKSRWDVLKDRRAGAKRNKLAEEINKEVGQYIERFPRKLREKASRLQRILEPDPMQKLWVFRHLNAVLTSTPYQEFTDLRKAQAFVRENTPLIVKKPGLKGWEEAEEIGINIAETREEAQKNVGAVLREHGRVFVMGLRERTKAVRALVNMALAYKKSSKQIENNVEERRRNQAWNLILTSTEYAINSLPDKEEIVRVALRGRFSKKFGNAGWRPI